MRNCAFTAWLATFFLALLTAELRAATLTVTDPGDSGTGTLRDTVGTAASGDIIVFDPAVTSITLASEIAIAIDLEVNGLGTSALSISGNSVTRVFNITAGTVAIRDMTLTDGNAGTSGGGGAIQIAAGATVTVERCEIMNCQCSVASFDGGGAIRTGGALTVRDTLVDTCSNVGATGAGGGVWVPLGGTMTMERCEVTGCSAARCAGVGCQSGSTFRWSTFHGNNATDTRGGLYGQGTSDTYVVENCTVANNTAANQWDGFFPIQGLWTITNCTLSGNGTTDFITPIAGSGTVTMTGNAIGNVTIFSTTGTVVSNGFNVVSSPGGSTGWGGNDNIGAAAPINLMLGTLQNNGGPTPTMLPQVGSPLIDFVTGGTPPDLDQRGLIRFATADSGAVEVDGAGPFSVAPNPSSPGGSVTLTGQDMTQITGVTVGGVTATLGASTATTLAITLGGSTPVGVRQSIAASVNTQTTDWLTLNVTATPGPEIDVQRPAGTSIASGGPDALGSIAVGAPSQFTYTVANTGTSDLTVTGIAESALTNCSVTVGVLTPASPVPAASSATFTVDVTPTIAGTFSFTLTITNDDTDEGTYTVLASGTGIVAPEIDLQVPTGTSIANGGSGTVADMTIGAGTQVTVTIANLGTGDLTLSANPTAAAITNCTATVTTNPASLTVAASSSTTFVVTVTPTAAGALSFTVTVTSDDSDESTYTITLNSNGIIATAGGGGGGGGCCSVGGDPSAEGSNVLGLMLVLVALMATLALRRRV